MNEYLRPRLLAEDGAKFYVHFKKCDAGQFQVTCHARIEMGDSTIEEQPEYKLCDTIELAHAWAHQKAASRNFKTLLIEK